MLMSYYEAATAAVHKRLTSTQITIINKTTCFRTSGSDYWLKNILMGIWWPSGRASYSKSKGPWFDPYWGHCVVLEQDTLPLEYWLIPRKRWLCPDMTEKLLTRRLNLNTKTNKSFLLSCLV